MLAVPMVRERRPTMIKRLSFRVRLERNIPVMIEFSGELDFETEMEQHLRLMAALKMFELGKISSDKAAELAGMSRVEFFEACRRSSCTS